MASNLKPIMETQQEALVSTMKKKRIVISQSLNGSGVARLVLRMEYSNPEYSTSITINRNMLTPKKRNAEYCHPTGYRSMWSGKQVDA